MVSSNLIVLSLMYGIVTIWILIRLFVEPSITKESEAFDIRRVCGRLEMIERKIVGKLFLGSEERYERIKNYVFVEANPLIQIFYLLLMSGGYGLVLYDIYPRLPCGKYLSEDHKYWGILSFALCLGSFVKACVSNPGAFHNEKEALKFDFYPYDNIMYVRGRICPSHNLRKIARSKFCQYSSCNIARFDHFCPWLNKAIGQLNYRWFLLFLIIHIFTLTYGALACLVILYEYIERQHLLQATFIDTTTGKTVSANWNIVLRFLFGTQRIPIALFLVCFGMNLIVVAFFSFHLYLISLNVTTNEFFKWRKVTAYCRKHNISPLPPNIYNRGLFLNFLEVIFARPLFAIAVEKKEEMKNNLTFLNKLDEEKKQQQYNITTKRPLFFDIFASSHASSSSSSDLFSPQHEEEADDAKISVAHSKKEEEKHCTADEKHLIR